MADTRKYLDYEGLSEYDEKIKRYIIGNTPTLETYGFAQDSEGALYQSKEATTLMTDETGLDIVEAIRNLKSPDDYNIFHEMLLRELKNLSLSYDGQYWSLSYNGEVLTYCEDIEADNTIYCTSFKITSPKLVEITTDETSQITYQIAPINCTQRVKFIPSNMDVFNVTDLGLIQPLGPAGNGTITAQCGSIQDTIDVKVKKILRYPLYPANWMSAFSNNTGLRIIGKTPYNNYGLLSTADDGFLIHAGETIKSIRANNDFYFTKLWLLYKDDNADAVYTVESDGGRTLTNVEVVEQTSPGWGKDFSITVDRDCYLGCLLAYKDGSANHTWSQDNADNLVATDWLKFEITAPEN